MFTCLVSANHSALKEEAATFDSLIIGGPKGGPVHADVTTQGPPTRLEANSKLKHGGLSQETNPLSHPGAILRMNEKRKGDKLDAKLSVDDQRFSKTWMVA